jgi:hypothetical protein
MKLSELYWDIAFIEDDEGIYIDSLSSEFADLMFDEFVEALYDGRFTRE